MRASNVLGIIYSSVYDEYISELTSVRTVGSVPFGGRYRLIDFCLSNMVECGINKVGINTKSNYQSLMDHLGSGKPWDLSRKREGMTILPPFNLVGSGGMFNTRLEALQSIMNYISRSNKEYVLFADANVVYNLDFEKIIDCHIQSGADITIAYKHGVKPRIQNIMTFELEGDRITKALVGETGDNEKNYSLNLILIKRILLERLVNAAAAAGVTSFERDIIGANTSSLYIRGHKVEDFAFTIDSLQTYYNVSMSLVNGGYKKLFKKDMPIYTKVRDDMPAIYGVSSKASNSLIADGCIIKGTVENSILFRGVYIAEGAVVKNSVLMQDSYVSQGSKLNYAILDKNVVIRPDKELSGAETYPICIGKDITV